MEEELREIRPSSPSPDFEKRLERALGDAGNLALRRVSGSSSVSSFPVEKQRGGGKLVSFAIMGFGLSAAAALVVAAFIIGFSFGEDPSKESFSPAVSVAEGDAVGVDDSPVHGVPSSAILTFSGEGWATPEKRETLVEATDEGIIERPDGPPARRYRYHYLDETIWKHPETNTLIRSAVPREEVLLVGLELY